MGLNEKPGCTEPNNQKECTNDGNCIIPLIMCKVCLERFNNE